MAQRAEKVKRYVEDQQLPVDILIDDSRDVLRAYGAWQETGGQAGPITRPSLYLIGPDGTIRYAFVAQWQHEFPGFEEVAGVIRTAAGGSQ